MQKYQNFATGIKNSTLQNIQNFQCRPDIENIQIQYRINPEYTFV